ncbi:MAG: hypothetical protein WBX25_19525 [Rhodomicrobium sp.]
MEDWIGEDNPVRVVDVFVDGLNLSGLCFDGLTREAFGRPAIIRLPKLYIYGYLNHVRSSRRLQT